MTVVSAWANDVWNYNVYDDCSQNGYNAGYASAPTDVQAIDLGLPSGLKWASCNVGAEKPEDYGNYYAWGEVVPKEEYEWSTYKYGIGEQQLTKYCNDASYGDSGYKDEKTILDAEDDAAYVNWGNGWRMPTDAEWTELRSNCVWATENNNGVVGFRVTSKTNGNSIFLPAAGYQHGTRSCSAGEYSDYFSSQLYTSNPSYAAYFYSRVGGSHANRGWPHSHGVSSGLRERWNIGKFF